MTTNSINFLKFALSILLLSNSVLMFYIFKQEKNQQKQNSELINVTIKLDSLIKNNFEKQSKKNICLNVSVEAEKMQELEPVKIKHTEKILNIITDVTAIEAPIREYEVERCGISFLAEKATPKEGIQSFYDYISKNINYPINARRNSIEGEVMVGFSVDRNGEITDVIAKNDIGGGCKEEAERVIKNSPKWNPAKQRGKTAKTRMTIPIVFKLEIQSE